MGSGNLYFAVVQAQLLSLYLEIRYTSHLNGTFFETLEEKKIVVEFRNDTIMTMPLHYRVK